MAQTNASVNDSIRFLLRTFGRIEHRGVDEFRGTIAPSYSISKIVLKAKMGSGTVYGPKVPPTVKSYAEPLFLVAERLRGPGPDQNVILEEDDFLLSLDQSADLSMLPVAARQEAREWAAAFVMANWPWFRSLVLSPVGGSPTSLVAIIVSAQCILLLAASRFEEAYHIAGKFVYEYVRQRAEQALALKREARRGRRS